MKAKHESGVFRLSLRLVYRLLSGADPARQAEIARAILKMAQADRRQDVVEVSGQLRAELVRQENGYTDANLELLQGMRTRVKSEEPRRHPDVKSELVRATIYATEAAGLMDQPAFLAAIGMREGWIVNAISKPETVPLEEYVRVYDAAANQAGWHPLHEVVNQVTIRQRFREWP